MPRNSSGVYSLPQAPFVAGTTISSAAVNSNFTDIASALTGSLPTNGSAPMVGQLKVSDGSSIAPSYSFTNETNTGFFRASAGTIGIDILGIEIGTINANGIQAPVLGAAPIGSVLSYGGATAPATWLLCFGQAISRTTYALLFTAIGTIFGSGDGVTTFNVPDMRGTVDIGSDNIGGTIAGRLTTSFYGTSPDVLAARGGAQSVSISSTNLPSYTPSGSIANGSITSTPNGSWGVGNSFNSAAPQGGPTYAVVTATLSVSSSQGASSFSGVNNGGTASPFPIIQPSLTFNKIIFAGV